MTLIIISDIVSLEDRGKYQGINEAVIAISNGVGPVLGGVFSQYTTWRWAFWINLPLTGIAIAVSIWLLPLKAVKGNAREKLLKIDYVGSGLTILGWVLILLGINWGGVTYPWTSGAVLAPLLLGVATIAVFMLWEAKFAQLPIVPVHIFKYKTVVGVYLCTAMNGMTFFTVLYYVPQFLQLVRGYNSVTASLLTLPILAPVAVFVFISGQIVARTGRYRTLIIGGYMVWTISQGLQSTIDRYTSPAKIAGFLLIGGVGSGFTFQTSLLAAQAAVPRHEMAVVTGVRNFLRLLGSTLALAIAGALVNNALRSALSPLGLSAEEVNTLLDNPTAINDPSFRDTLTIAQRDAVIAGYSRGFKSVFYMTVACMVIATLSAVFLIGHHDLKRSDDQKLKEESIQRLQDKKMKRKEGGVDAEKGQKEGAGDVLDGVHALSDEKEHVEAPGSTSHRP
jgi:MFS family permease